MSKSAVFFGVVGTGVYEREAKYGVGSSGLNSIAETLKEGEARKAAAVAAVVAAIVLRKGAILWYWKLRLWLLLVVELKSRKQIEK